MNIDKQLRMGSVKELVLALIDEYGGPDKSIMEAGRQLGIDYQRLQYWRDSGRKIQQFIDFLENTRRKRKISKSALWDAITTKKK